MIKAMCISGIVFGVLFVFVFTFDLIFSFPFSGASKSMDIGFIIGGIILAYMGWSARREVT